MIAVMKQHGTGTLQPIKAAHGEIDRLAELSRLLPLWPSELNDTSREGRLKVLAKLERAIRTERRRGRAGHWAYDLARHAALFRWYKIERAALEMSGIRTRIAYRAGQNAKGPPCSDEPR